MLPFVNPAQKPFSEACEQNKDPILEVLRHWLTTPSTVLEIGSGTGQHAAYFASQLPHLTWQPTDVAAHLAGIELWRQAAQCSNLLPTQVLDVKQQPWPVQTADAVYSANTAHIMSWAEVVQCFQGVANCLNRGGYFFLYGPFSYQGQHISDSNAQFDHFLKMRDPLSGVRDVQDLQRLAEAQGLQWVTDCVMPVNNRILIWKQP